MTKLTALKELLVKVKGGSLNLGVNGDFALVRSIWPDGTKDRHNLRYSYYGSLDAAQALHKAVLGDGWVWYLENDHCSIRSPDRAFQFGSFNASPARAWLIAIIKAKIAELEGEGNV